ncbi:MAG TPA: hypothetical protein VGK55_02715 [Actinomycetes bacterium]|jgi:hypothetical protein
MHENQPTERSRPSRKLLSAAGLLAAGAVAGGVLASNLTASADDNSSSGSTAPPSATSQSRPPAGTAGGAAPVRSDEKALTGSDADKVRAAALDAVPGGTVYRVETDADGDAYEAHMTKSDGSPVTVKLDEEFNVTGVEDGMGSGGGSAPDASHAPESGSGSPAPR